MIIFEKQIFEKKEIINISRETNILKVQVTGNGGQIVIKGSLTGLEEKDFVTLTGISDTGLKPVDVITDGNGMYTYDVSGMCKIRVERSADATINLVGVGDN